MTNIKSSSSACCRIFATLLVSFGSLASVEAAVAAAKRDDGQRLRIVGGLGAAPRDARLEAPFWAKELPRLSAGKFAAEMVPLNQAGVARHDMLRLMQLGVVPFGTALYGQMAAQGPEFSAPDLAGLNPDMRTLRKTVVALRPHLERALRQQREIEVLALSAYPAGIIFCNKPRNGVRSIAGRRVRVSGPTSADFVEALGGVPVVTLFNDIIANMQSDAIDCAITGAMPGNAIGLHRLSTHLHAMPVTWGLALFGTNSTIGEQLDPELRTLLRREQPRLEAAIWDDAEQETAGGIACNAGDASCTGGTAGSMIAVRASVAGEERRKEMVRSRILPRWIRRCGPSCGDLWNKTLTPVTRIKVAL